MKVSTYYVLPVLILTIIGAECARILGVFPISGYSQFVLAEKLFGELAKKGHVVTVISAFEPKVRIDNYETILNRKIDGATDRYQTKSWNEYKQKVEFLERCTKNTESLLAEKEVQRLIHSNEKFDLVIVENFGNEAHMGFAAHFKAPLVIFSSQGLHEWSSHLVGNVRLPSINPVSATSYTNWMDFSGRLHNTLLTIFDYVYKELIYFPNQQEMLNTYFPNKMDLKTVFTSAEVLLLFSNPLTTEPSLLTSCVVEIGGFHISHKKLPDTVQNFLNGAPNGAILFSFGSNLDCKNMSKEKFSLFLNVIGKLPQRVLWKCDADIPNKPDNLLLSKWLPQSDILAHPKTICFVTHNGLLSTTEAIYHGVPMVSIPIFGDQAMNAARAVKNGIAMKLDYLNFTEDQLFDAITELTTNSKYKQRSEKLSRMFKDQPVSPLDLAMHTIEYVLKYEPGQILRSPALDLWWFQLYSLDILVLIMCFILLSVISSVRLGKLIFGNVRSRKSKTA